MARYIVEHPDSDYDVLLTELEGQVDLKFDTKRFEPEKISVP